MFVLVCSPLAFQTALRGPLTRPGNLFDLFSKRCIYVSTILIGLDLLLGSLHPFSLLRSITSSFFLLPSVSEVGIIFSCSPFSYLIFFKKK